MTGRNLGALRAIAFGLAAVALIALGAVGEAVLGGRQQLGQVPAMTPAPTAVPSPSVPSTDITNLRGRLAMWSGVAASGGFVTFPSGRFEVDVASNVGFPTDSPGTPSLVYGLAYDASLKHWVPVPRRLVRASGQGYVFSKTIDGYFVVTVVRSDGTSYNLPRFPWNGSYFGYTLIGAEPEGIYYSDADGKLWVIDYLGSSLRKVSDLSLNWLAATRGFAYGISSQGGVNPVVRIDLLTGAGGNWFQRQGLAPRLIGFTEEGAPIVAADQVHRTELWLMDSTPKLLKSVDAAGTNPGRPPLDATSASGSASGIWVATDRGLYLYTSRDGWVFAATGGGDVISAFIPG